MKCYYDGIFPLPVAFHQCCFHIIHCRVGSSAVLVTPSLDSVLLLACRPVLRYTEHIVSCQIQI